MNPQLSTVVALLSIRLAFAGDIITLQDGSRLEGTILSTTAKEMYIVLGSGAGRHIPMETISSYQWRGKTEVLGQPTTRPAADCAVSPKAGVSGVPATQAGFQSRAVTTSKPAHEQPGNLSPGGQLALRPEPQSTRPATAGAVGVVCNKFVLVTKPAGHIINLFVDTDLPDDTEVLVDVSRCFLKKGDSSRYTVSYFSEKSTIGMWRSPRKITINDESWKADLSARQEMLSRIGSRFDVESVSDTIDVDMVVPINQANPKFGQGNQKLMGTAVSTSGLRVVKKEIAIKKPLMAPFKSDSPFPSLDPAALDIGRRYVVSKKTPLMPHHSPDDPIAALQEMKNIPEVGKITILQVYEKNGNPWYKVKAVDQAGNPIGTGWVNSLALVGQQLKSEK